jgi:methionyl-tRNA synthetase
VQPEAGVESDEDRAIRELADSVTAAADAHIESFAVHEAIAEIWKLVDALNGYITSQEPWVLAKNEDQRERLATVLATATEGLRALAELLHPVIPLATQKLWVALGAEEALGALADQPLRAAGNWNRLPAGTPQQPLAVLFPRIETDESK